MKTIPLSQGKFAIVDDEDFDRVNVYKWTWTKRSNDSGEGYALRTFGPRKQRKREMLHNFIMKIEVGTIRADHKNGNGLDNRKENLRLSTQQQNLRNRSHDPLAKSGFRGVYFKKNVSKPWYSRIRVEGKKNIHLGYFITPEEAAKAFDQAAKLYFGEFCGKLNYE